MHNFYTTTVAKEQHCLQENCYQIMIGMGAEMFQNLNMMNANLGCFRNTPQ